MANIITGKIYNVYLTKKFILENIKYQLMKLLIMCSIEVTKNSYICIVFMVKTIETQLFNVILESPT